MRRDISVEVSDLLEEAERRGLMSLSPDERSGGYVIQKIAAN